jgi:hypothetical protein
VVIIYLLVIEVGTFTSGKTIMTIELELEVCNWVTITGTYTVSTSCRKVTILGSTIENTIIS